MTTTMTGPHDPQAAPAGTAVWSSVCSFGRVLIMSSDDRSDP
jgi:hypothetical protein